MQTFPSAKDPTDVSDWAIGFVGVLDGDTIASIDAVAITPVTVPPLEEMNASPSPRSFTDDTVTIWLEGGKPGTKYTIAVTVTTASARVFERSARLKVKDL